MMKSIFKMISDIFYVNDSYHHYNTRQKKQPSGQSSSPGFINNINVSLLSLKMS